MGLNILLLSYIAFGAFVFIFLEADHELNQRKEKVQQVLNIYRMIMNKTAAICMANPAVNEWMVGFLSTSFPPEMDRIVISLSTTGLAYFNFSQEEGTVGIFLEVFKRTNDVLSVKILCFS